MKKFQQLTNDYLTPAIGVGIVCLAAIFIAGCGSDIQTGDRQSEGDFLESADKMAQTTTVDVSPTTTTRSPAADSDTANLDTHASPEQVCRQFLEFLNNGRRVKAEELLTKAALDTTSKAGLYLQPIANSSAKLTFEPAAYATSKKKLAHVGCKIEEKIDDVVVTDHQTWVARKSRQGWKIVGFIIKDGQRQDFLSFENRQDVAVMMEMSQPVPDQRQASTAAFDRRSRIQ